MNSFFVPQLGSQIYTMGGMTTHLHLLADAPGEYSGFSAMFSGDGFSDMRFIAKAVPPTTYRAVEPNLFKHIIDQTVAGPGKAGVNADWCPPRRQAGG